MTRTLARLLVAAPLALGACATMMEGTAQSVAIDTSPAGALCTIDRSGARLGAVAATPGSLRVDKSKNDITVSCSKDGYQQAVISESPKFVGTTFGNILIGGGIGAIVDAASGANYEYPDRIHIEMYSSAPTARLP